MLPTRIQEISGKSSNLKTKVTSPTELQKNQTSFCTKHKILTVRKLKRNMKKLSILKKQSIKVRFYIRKILKFIFK
jgi:hypothetical protein